LALHAFVTDRVGTTVELDQDHRAITERASCPLNWTVPARALGR